MKVIDQLHAPPALIPEAEPPVPVRGNAERAQSQSRRCGEENTSHAPAGSWIRFLGRPAHSQVTVSTELPWLFLYLYFI
jgi:hypothetical protein